ncbi:uncharacterized protein Pyn_23449 [Prunus yedoensis var. nudiflora]|uniref:Uncharacterized protein n=1 Tax=Prunus yedoensis var. nudiflora TaxID=2094558 RepID=A0A314UJ88_PRUYE|nr:uncharacterized protein Pyn_23449 [Prunus yedoensis var. nudiflora]
MLKSLALNYLLLGVLDPKATEELTFNVGVNEVVNLLMRSLVSKTPLTDMFLKPKPESKLVHELANQPRGFCYAEAREDFMGDGSSSWKGCIDNLYKSVEDIDGQYLKSTSHQTILLSPKLAPGFSYPNHPLGIEEATFHCSNESLKPVSVDPKSPYNEDCCVEGFLRGRPAMFMVTDSLAVRPLSPIFGISILNQLSVPVTNIEMQTMNLGKVEFPYDSYLVTEADAKLLVEPNKTRPETIGKIAVHCL